MRTDFATAEIVAGIIALVTSWWALWVRRHTWGMYWEWAATVGVLLNAVALILQSKQVGDPLGRWLFGITGVGGLDDYLAHLMVMGGTAAFVVHMQIRTQEMDDVLRRKLFRRLNMPLTLVVPLMLALILKSPSTHQGPVDLALLVCGPWMKAYWMVMCGTCAYLQVYLTLLLLDIRLDPRSRRLATLYLVGMLFGFISAGIAVVTRLYNDTSNERYMWLFACLATTVVSAAAGISWLAKSYRYRLAEHPNHPMGRIIRWFWERQERQVIPVPDASLSDQREDTHDGLPPTSGP